MLNKSHTILLSFEVLYIYTRDKSYTFAVVFLIDALEMVIKLISTDFKTFSIILLARY